jgi:protein-tyrosine-phosphatase/glycosyltransferase A (GT-A) superfamily protein (DUF2064 family)
VFATVVVLTKLPGLLPVKTRLWPVLGEALARDLYVEMVRDTLEVARTLDPWPVVAYSPPDGDPRKALPGVSDCEFLALRSVGGAACLEEALAGSYASMPLVALGGDAPDLPAERLREVAASLERHDAALVPSGDGGFSCLGLRRPAPGLGGAFRYGGDDALAAVERFLAARGLSVTRLEPWPDVDSPDDLAAYRSRQAERAATAPDPIRGGSGGRRTKRVLFVCVENSNRSQMAEAFALMAGAAAWSAGSRPSGRVNPKAVEAMREVGYDLSTHRSKSLAQIPPVGLDAVVTMGCGDACALRSSLAEEWRIPDPRDMDAEGIRRVRDAIRAKVAELLGRI